MKKVRIKARKYNREKDKCLIDCLANLLNIPFNKVFDIYKHELRVIPLYNWLQKEHGIQLIIIDDPAIRFILPLGLHIRVGKSSMSQPNTSGTHACIYDWNECIYCPARTRGLVPNTVQYYMFFDGLDFNIE